MPFKTAQLVVSASLAIVAASFALETVNHVNDAALLPVGARSAGLAGVSIGMEGDPSHLALSPAGLADIRRPEVVIHHAGLYEDLSISQDEVYLAAPLSYGVLGLGISRVGADGILRAEEGRAPDFSNPSTFSATDWVASVAFARAWFDGSLRGGAALRLLGREIDDYLGAGAQLDASLVWYRDGFRAGARLDRGLGGLATWKSGHTEYTPPDLIVGLGYGRRMPYFYGTGAIGWETAGLLREQSASTFSENDARPWIDPWLALRSSRLGAEFRFDMGLVLRAGCEVQALTRVLDFLQGDDQRGQFGESRGLVSGGAGYLWSDRVRVDYTLSAHPDLGTTQRIALGIVFGAHAKHVDVERPREEPVEPPAEPVTVPVQSPIATDSVRSIDSASPVAAQPADSVEAPETAPAAPEVPATDSVSAPKIAPPASGQVRQVPEAAPVVVPKPVPEAAPKSAQPAPKPVAPKPSAPTDEWDAPEQTAP